MSAKYGALETDSLSEFEMCIGGLHLQGFFALALLCGVAQSWWLLLPALCSDSVAASMGVTESEMSIATSFMFLSFGISSPLIGAWCDESGRKVTATRSGLLGAVCVLVEAISWNFWMFALARAVLGVAIAGNALSSLTYMLELSPPSRRASANALAQVAFSFGSVSLALLAWLLLPYSWRFLSFASAIPPLSAVLLLRQVPESCPWLAQRNRIHETVAGLTVLAQAAGDHEAVSRLVTVVLKANGEQSLLKRNSFQSSSTKNILQGLAAPLRPSLRSKTITLTFCWSAACVVYYCLNYAANEIMPGPLSNPSLATVILAIVECPAYALQRWLVDRAWTGRRRTQAIFFFVSAGSHILLQLARTATDTRPSTPCLVGLLLLVIAARIAICGAFANVWIITPETMPTQVRSAGIGLCNFVSRTAAIFVPYLALLPPLLGNCIAAAVAFLAAVLTLIYLDETRNRPLQHKMLEDIPLASTPVLNDTVANDNVLLQ